MLLKPPIKLLTPPIKVTQPSQKPNKQSSGGGGSAPSFEAIFADMLKTYLPETITFEPLGEDVLRETIANWLRPAYEQAIKSREQRTERSNAELDADAWARGMGASTYVTDVKDRAYRSEAQDISDLESDYASNLAGELYDAMRAQQEQKIEVDKFNAEQINRAREKAAAAAQALYASYRSGGGRSGSSNSASTNGLNPLLNAVLGYTPETAGSATVDYKTAANLLSRLTPEQRRAFYAGEGAYAEQNAEILNGLSRAEYERLKSQFPAA